jgi:hypothetical protein
MQQNNNPNGDVREFTNVAMLMWETEDLSTAVWALKQGFAQTVENRELFHFLYCQLAKH